ncbi:MAG: IPT/TIG domain-containing protein [Oligoflexus sp.]|nr:IPT/TIG domain-containing protein [Oligoflexus sp.]
MINGDSQTASLNSGFACSGGGNPLISSVSPSYGSIVGGTVVNISGSDFLTGLNVKVGGADCSNVIFVAATSVYCTLSTHVAGLSDVVVTNPDNRSGILNNGFTYSAGLTSTLSYAVPNFGPISGRTSVQIIGSGFIPGARATIGGVACSTLTLLSSTALQCTTAGNTYGAKNISVANPDGQSTTLSNFKLWTGCQRGRRCRWRWAFGLYDSPALS